MNETFLKHKFLFLPLLLATFIFSLDKLFGLTCIRKYTESRIEYAFYAEKKDLLEQLLNFQKNQKPEEKLLVLFGTSHMGEFSHKYIHEKNEKITTYNFSAPMAPPSYLYYNLQTVLDAGAKIDYAVLEIIPETFQAAANEYALKFSYDWKFMYENKDIFSEQEIESFIHANLFSVVRFPPRLNIAMQRIKDKNAIAGFEYFNSMVKLATKQNNGGIPNPIIHEIPEDFFEKESKVYFAQAFRKSGNLSYSESKTQKAFYERFIETCKKNNIQLLIYKPILSKPLQKLLDESDFYETWWKDKVEIANQKGITVLDMAEYSTSIQCQKFVDVHHLSGGCYPEITDILLEKILPQMNGSTHSTGSGESSSPQRTDEHR
ncbi:MAG: DUF1574 family protein [Leptospiraceae bacterium]|nr:DUF1574 family protein [Leptospiraceae bacterium]